MGLRYTSGSVLTFDQQLQDYIDKPEYSMAETVGERLSDDVQNTPLLGSSYRLATTPSLAIKKERDPGYDMLGGGYGARAGTTERALSVEEATQIGERLLSQDEYRKSPWFHPDVPWVPGMTESRAKVLFDQATTREARKLYTKARPITAGVTSFLSGFLDPVNYIPVFGEVAGVSTLSRMLLIPATENIIAGLGTTLATREYNRQFSLENNSADAIMQSVALNAAFGPIMHVLGGVGRSVISRYTSQIKVPPIPKLPEPIPAQVPAPEEVTAGLPPELITEEGISAKFAYPYDVSHVQTQRMDEVSNVVINDAIQNMIEGKDPQIGELSQSLIAQLGPETYRHLEQDRYELNISEEINEMAKLIEENIAGERKGLRLTYIEAKRAERAQERLLAKDPTAYDQIDELFNRRMGFPPEDVEIDPKVVAIFEEKFRTKQVYENQKMELQDALVQRQKLISERKGYVTEPPTIMYGLDYEAMNTHVDLPPEIVADLPPAIKKEFDDLIAINKINPVKRFTARMKRMIAPYLGKQYAAVYGGLLHGTPSVFDVHDPQYLGSMTGAPSAHEAFWFAGLPSTSNYYSKMHMVPMLEPIDQDIAKYANMQKSFADVPLVTIQDKVGNLEDMFNMSFVEGKEKEIDELADILRKYLKIDEAKSKLDIDNKKQAAKIKKLEDEQALLADDFKKKYKIAKGESPFMSNVRLQNVILKNPYVYDMEGRSYAEIHDTEGMGLTGHILAAKKHGNDGMIFLNLVDPGFPDTHIAVWNVDQIENGLAPSKPMDWGTPAVDVSWKVAADDLAKAAVDFSKPMNNDVKFEEGNAVDNIDVTKPKGVADSELDRMSIELAKANMTEAEAASFDEQLKSIDEEMASDDRLTKATEAVIKCRNK